MRPPRYLYTKPSSTSQHTRNAFRLPVKGEKMDCWVRARPDGSVLPKDIKVKDARAAIAQAFKDDPDFRRAYVANVACLLHDEAVGVIVLNAVADKIIKLVFES